MPYQYLLFDYFHGIPCPGNYWDSLLNSISKNNRRIAGARVTNSRIARLIKNYGISESQVFEIPIPVDKTLFYPARDKEEAQRIKLRYSLPLDKIIIGNFQKDGNGFEYFGSPKYIKGPDILADVLISLYNYYKDIYIVLVGPSRSYICKRLTDAAVPYAHLYVDFNEIPLLHRVNDLYINTSRDEGGPKGVLEALASGVPVVSTPVGMVPDLVDETTCLCSETFLPNDIFTICCKVLETPNKPMSLNKLLPGIQDYKDGLLQMFYSLGLC